MTDPDLRPRFDLLGLEPNAQGPAAMARFVVEQYERMGALIRQEGIRING